VKSGREDRQRMQGHMGKRVQLRDTVQQKGESNHWYRSWEDQGVLKTNGKVYFLGEDLGVLHETDKY